MCGVKIPAHGSTGNSGLTLFIKTLVCRGATLETELVPKRPGAYRCLGREGRDKGQPAT